MAIYAFDEVCMKKVPISLNLFKLLLATFQAGISSTIIQFDLI